MRHSYLDQYSEIDSFIHRMDPRIKIIVFITFILFVIFTPLEKIHIIKGLFVTGQTGQISLTGFTPLNALNEAASLASFGIYAALLFALILVSKIPFWFVIKRLLTILSFVFFIAIFLLFFKEGRPLWEYSIGRLKLSITGEGLLMFSSVAIKAFLSALCMTLLVATTRFSDLLKGLEWFKFPSLCVMIVSFMYRYLFVIENELMVMDQARRARSAGGSRWFQARAMANILGILFIRSYERSELVYLAMRSRGFDGKTKTLNDFRIKAPDIIFLFVMILFLTGARLAGVYYG